VKIGATKNPVGVGETYRVRREESRGCSVLSIVLQVLRRHHAKVLDSRYILAIFTSKSSG
jgi:hypothetical protein